jgi:tRNA pseudouridine55 synthase
VGRRRRRPDEPDRSAILLVDKPAGPTSHDVVQAVRRASGQSRVGHTGTLDPAATGVLVLCLGRAAKLVRFLQAGSKTYAARMVLGIETDTQDAHGEVVARHPAGHVDERTFCEALTRFQGDIEQVPPMVSALKVGGERLHAIARRGEEVDREPRPVTVEALVLDRYERGRDPDHPEASFLVTCSAGTYVRTLAHDLGASLGVGGSLTSLRRVANGPFTVEESPPLEAVTDAAAKGRLDDLLLDPLAAIARVLPVVEVTDPAEVRRLAQGGRAPLTGQPGPFAVRSGARLVGVYADAGHEARAELVWVRPEELPPPDASTRPRDQEPDERSQQP